MILSRLPQLTLMACHGFRSTAKPTDAREHLLRTQHRRRAALWTLAVVVLAGALLVGTAWPQSGRIRVGIEWVGLACIFLAILGRCSCILYLGGRKSRELMTLGPYSVTRNPLYLSSLLAAFGMGLQTGSITVGLIFIGIVFAVFRWVIAEEEAVLRLTFGRSFTEYCACVPRLWPRHPLSWRSPERLDVDLVSLRKTVRDGMWFFLSVPIFQAIAYVHQVGWVHAQVWLY